VADVIVVPLICNLQTTSGPLFTIQATNAEKHLLPVYAGTGRLSGALKSPFLSEYLIRDNYDAIKYTGGSASFPSPQSTFYQVSYFPLSKVEISTGLGTSLDDGVIVRVDRDNPWKPSFQPQPGNCWLLRRLLLRVYTGI
jgi:hypothetical protein